MSEQSAELNNILARLERVERENGRLKRTGLALLVLVGAVLLMGQARPSNRTVEAEKFILKDESGRTRARLEMEGGDKPTLVLLDANGFPLVSLAAGEAPKLVLCRAYCSNNQVQLGTLQDDLYGLALYGNGGVGACCVRAGLGVFQGTPGLSLYDEKGTEQAGLDLGELGPSLTLRDNGIPTATLSVAHDRTSFELSDKQGFRTTIGSTDLETPRTGETHKTSAASIILSGKDGKTLWSAP